MRTSILITISLRFLVSALLGLLCFYFSIDSALADRTSLTTKQKQLGKLDHQIKSLKNNLSSNKSKRNRLTKQLEGIDKEISVISKKLIRINHSIKNKSQQLKDLEKQAEQLKQQQQQQMHLLQQQLRAAYALGTNSYFKLILNQQSPETSSRLITYYHYFNDARVDAMQTIEGLIQASAENSKKITANKKQLQQLKQQQQNKRQQRQQAQENQKQVIRRINKTISSKQQQLKQLLANKKALQRIVNSLQASTKAKKQQQSFVKQRRSLPLPTQGKIIQHFGTPIGNSQLKYSGMLIAAPHDQAIKAVHPGRVVFANWLRGFGLLLIIEHDNGYMTLYGHNNSLYKKNGDQVSAGELIATVGNSGGNNKNALYFEVRHKGKPLDPEQWCRV